MRTVSSHDIEGLSPCTLYEMIVFNVKSFLRASHVAAAEKRANDGRARDTQQGTQICGGRKTSTDPGTCSQLAVFRASHHRLMRPVGCGVWRHDEQVPAEEGGWRLSFQASWGPQRHARPKLGLDPERTDARSSGDFGPTGVVS